MIPNRVPETNPILAETACEEVIDFFSFCPPSALTRCLRPFSAGSVITMDGGGDCDAGHSRRHELQQSHLRRRVLHGDPVGGELDYEVPARQ